MRQAMSQQHQQQMDTGDEYKHAPNGAAPNLAPRRDSMPASPTDTPMFYISTVESTKHKFTVTTQFNYPNQQQGAPNGAMMANCTNGGSNGSQNQPEFTHGHMSAPQVPYFQWLIIHKTITGLNVCGSIGILISTIKIQP